MGRGVDDGGEEPDARFTLANERTLLAWVRTSIALVGGGLASSQLLQQLPGVQWALAIPLAVLGLAMAATSYGHFLDIERAMRHREPLPRSPLPRLLSVGVTLIAVAACVLILLDAL